MLSGSIGKEYFRNHIILSQLSGVIILFFGISMLGIINIPNIFSKFFGRIKMPKSLCAGYPSSALLLGILFAIGLGPTCLGPILGYITLLAATTGTALHGGLLLTVYSLGIAIPFLLVAFLYGSSFSYIAKLTRVLPLINKVSGMLLIFIGVLLIMVNFGMINVWFEHFFKAQWYTDFVNYM